MITKLTLSIDDKIVKKAKEYSRKTGRSLSKMIENYLQSITSQENKNMDEEVPPFLKKWHGAFKNEDQRDYKEVVAEEIIRKQQHT